MSFSIPLQMFNSKRDLPALPKEIWKIISMVHPPAYYGLVRCCKSFTLPTEYIQNHFIKESISVGGDTLYSLPSGQLHNRDDLPAIIWRNNVDKGWYKCGKYQHLYHRAGGGSWINNINIEDERLGTTIYDVDRFCTLTTIRTVGDRFLVEFDNKPSCKCTIL
jgi:hypothetical protein